jgi:hypothetical protein
VAPLTQAPPADGPSGPGEVLTVGGEGQAGAEPYAVWARGEYLLWRVKNGPLPAALVTGGPAVAGPLTNTTAAARGSPGVQVLYGGDVNFGDLSGGRLTLGTWINRDVGSGVEFTGFLLGVGKETFAAKLGAGGLPVLGFPFTEQPGGVAEAFLADFPGRLQGGLSVTSTSRLGGAEVNMFGPPCGCGPDCHVQLLAGVRFVELEERLGLSLFQQAVGTSTVAFLGSSFPAPAAVLAKDKFTTRDEFYGGQVGARAEYYWGNLFVGAEVKLALGQTHEVERVGGKSQLLGTATPMAAEGGLFAQPSNIRRESHEEFSFLPEATVRVGYAFAPGVRGLVGYDILSWDNLIRPGLQVDQNVGTKQVAIDTAFSARATSPFPAHEFRHSDFWAQGFNAGLEFRY